MTERPTASGNPEVDRAKRLIEFYSDLYPDVRDSTVASYAMAAVMEGRPAFWSTSLNHNHAALQLTEAANRIPLSEAVKNLRRQGMVDTDTIGSSSILYLLGFLLPLNRSGAEALRRTRAITASHCGVVPQWRDLA